jgi:hypothetical protein
MDGAVDGGETDVDCGGSCGPCSSYKTCSGPNDCASQSCIANKCACAGSHIVMSEVRSRGANAMDEYIELFNPTSSDVVLTSAWKIEARSTTAASYTPRWTGTGKTIPAHGHFIIVGTAYASPPNPAGDEPLSTGITDATSLKLSQGGAVVDVVCFADNSNNVAALALAGYVCEGTAVLNTDPTKSIERKPGFPMGNCVDTDDNPTDFVIAAAISPQNRFSPPTP